MERRIAEAIGRANQVFTPGSPVSRKDFFSGRQEQLDRVVATITAPGRHPIIYGQRGVGKTSLANIISDSLTGNVMAAKISCDGADTFETMWSRMLRSTSFTIPERTLGFAKDVTTRKTTLSELLGAGSWKGTPAEMADILRRIPDVYSIFILDEFDKVVNREAKASAADLIKTVSDNAPRVTIVVVGVAQSISELIGEHPSIARNLVQIELPVMTDEEIKSIFSRGCRELRLALDEPVLDEVASLANGFPHYAHLLGLESAITCFKRDWTKVDIRAFQHACDQAVEGAQEKYRDAYSHATATTKRSRYPMIMCSCGYASHDDRGVFRATEVVDAMWTVFREKVSVPSVLPALGDFCLTERGGVLTKVPLRNRNHYKFTDPMMRPFLRIKTQSLLLTMQVG